MIITPLIEIWRHTFPKNLRWCRQCQILHAQLSAVDKRYKDRKYIPRSELANVIDSYVDGPPIFFLKWPVFRQLFLIRGINAIRVSRGYPAWLFTGAIRKEHRKITRWFDAHGNSLWIKREKFRAEVLDEFCVAQQYHKFFSLGMSFVALGLVLLVAGAISEPILYTYLYYIKGLKDREQIADSIAKILDQHATTEVSEDYKDILPPAAFTRPGTGDTVYFNIVEMTSPDNLCRIVFVPTPKVGPVSFYEKVGAVCRSCSALVLEEVPLNSLHRIPPAFFFFLEGRANYTFPSLNLHHRVYDILNDQNDPTPPPKLLPGAARPAMWMRYVLGITPFSVKFLYSPYFLTGSKQDAKIAWGTLKSVIRGEGFFPSSIEEQLEKREELLAKVKGDGSVNQLDVPVLRREIYSPDQLAQKRVVAEKEEEKLYQERQKAKVAAAQAKNEKLKKQMEEEQQRMLKYGATPPKEGIALEDSSLLDRKATTASASKGGNSSSSSSRLPSYDPSATPNILPSRPNLVSDSIPGHVIYQSTKLTGERRIYPSICVPWTVAQITNLESSFYRAGWKVTNIASIEWLSPHETGRTYFDYYREGQYKEMDWKSGGGTASLLGRMIGRNSAVQKKTTDTTTTATTTKSSSSTTTLGDAEQVRQIVPSPSRK